MEERKNIAVIDVEEHYDAVREMCDACALDPAKDYGMPRYLFTQKGIGFGPLGDIQMIKAPQKNGKTFLFALMMGALLRGEYCGLRCEVENPKILYIDTEQHPRNTQLVFRRVCKIGGIDGRLRHDNLKAYHFRGHNPDEIYKAVCYLIEKEKPTVVMLDGVRDLVHDFNDSQESTNMVTSLMKIALENDCSIWSILHVNPGTDKARGHLGTEMQNKVSDVLTCLKDKTLDGAVFTVEQTDARNRDIQSFSFIIQDVDDDHNGIIAVPVSSPMSIKAKTQADETLARALNGGPLRYTDLVDKVKEIAQTSAATAKRRIGDAIEAGIIYKDNVMNKYYYRGLDMENEPNAPF